MATGRLWVIALVGLAAMGCQSSTPESSSDEKATPVAANAPTSEAGSVEPQLPLTPVEGIGIFREHNNVRVGDTWDGAKNLFPEPPRGGYNLRDLPQKFGKNFDARGWERGTGEGFGVILYNGRIAAAMYQLEKTTQRTVDEFVQLQRYGTGRLSPTEISRKPLHYWFWHEQNQTLMICAFQQKIGISLSITMGDDNVLNALGISIAAAQRDTVRLAGPAPTIKPSVAATPTTGTIPH